MASTGGYTPRPPVRRARAGTLCSIRLRGRKRQQHRTSGKASVTTPVGAVLITTTGPHRCESGLRRLGVLPVGIEPGKYRRRLSPCRHREAHPHTERARDCLLYTSDAADDLTRVDL